jgi:hypothetical protein
MAENSLSKKLQLKAGLRAAVIDAPAGYIEKLGLPVDSELAGKPAASLDFVQIFLKTADELEAAIPPLMHALKFDGLFWISYPKGSSKVKTDLNRDILWKAMEKRGMAGVSLVSLDEVWSSMRFRPLEKTKSR